MNETDAKIQKLTDAVQALRAGCVAYRELSRVLLRGTDVPNQLLLRTDMADEAIEQSREVA